MDRRRNNEALARKVSPEAAPGNVEGRLMNLPGPGLYGEHGFKLYNRKVGDQRSRIRLLKNTVHVFGAALVVVTFRQRAGVEKIVWQISVLAGERLLPRKENQRLWTVRISLHPG